MLIVVLIGAIILYGFLYICYTLAEPHLDTSAGLLTNILRSLTEATLMPQNTVFVIFRGLIIATLFYVIAEWMVSTARHYKIKKTRLQETEAEWYAAGMAPPPPEPKPKRVKAPKKDEWRTRLESGINTRS